ncbi:MAG: hypothetical protein ABF646_02045 [Acetobacter papayae]
MTQTKLEIIGPYTPEHEGPHLFNGEECLVHGTLGTQAFISRPESDRGFIVNTFDLMNAREVPVVREFFVNEYSWGYGGLYGTQGGTQPGRVDSGFVRTVHLREVLPGEGA